MLSNPKKNQRCKAHDTVRLDLETGKAIWINDDEMMCSWFAVEFVSLCQNGACYGLLIFIMFLKPRYFLLNQPHSIGYTSDSPNQIVDYVKLELGNLVMISGGNNIGRVGTITQREPHPGSFEIVHIKVLDAGMLGRDAATYHYFMVLLPFSFGF